MCGIAGIMSVDGAQPSSETLDRLTAALLHRGPDGQGRHIRDGLAILQTRLAIIDLKTGDQPFYSRSQGDSQSTAMVANGEIYNYVELKEAMSEDVAFQTNSDCELPLHLYLRHGESFARHLRGMYSIAIDDPVKDQLVLARDPIGIKPLYYIESETGFSFSSEIDAFFTAGLIKPILRCHKLDELLQLQFTTGMETVYEGIYRALPGETLIIQGGKITKRIALKSLPMERPKPTSEQQALVELDRLLMESVDIHQRSDVPYGMFLSGGIDSTALLTLMERLNDRPVQTFTAGFSGTGVADEREHARNVATALKADFTEIDYSEQDFWNSLPAVAACMDDPVADYAILPTWKLAKRANDAGLKVVLSGEGGDELFAGYGRYRRAMRSKLLGGREMRSAGIFEGMGVLKHDNDDWRQGFVASGQGLPEQLTRLQQCQAVDCADWLPNDLLTKLDRCLMAHAIEGRVPFLDSEIANFVFLLPDKLKIQKGVGKWILRKWLEQALPMSRPFAKKLGFTVPVGEWITSKAIALAPLISAQEGILEMCNASAVSNLFKGDLTGKAGKAAWTLLFYAVWHQHHVLGASCEGDVFSVLSERP